MAEQNLIGPGNFPGLIPNFPQGNFPSGPGLIPPVIPIPSGPALIPTIPAIMPSPFLPIGNPKIRFDNFGPNIPNRNFKPE